MLLTALAFASLTQLTADGVNAPFVDGRTWGVDPSRVFVPAPRPDGTRDAAYYRGQLLLRFSPNADANARAEILGDRFELDRVLVAKMDLHLVKILDGSTVEQAMAFLNDLPGVVYATPDHVVSLRDTFPNDSQFGQQYGKHNTGQTGGTADSDIDAPEAWDFSTGTAEFAVGIVDSGTQTNHPDLIGNRWENAAEVNGSPGVDDDGNGYVDDLYGWDAYSNDGTIPTSNHGTHVAGIAAAQGDNGTGISGVTWDSEIVAIAGSSGQTSVVLLAYGYALDLKDDWLSSNGTEGANIVSVNSSFGVDFANCSSPTYAPWNDMFDLMGQSGILSVAATMNNTANVDTQGDVPTGCTSDYLVTVTATNDRDARTFSAFGATSIDLGAPGESVYSTLNGSGYGNLSGTSMATPQVTGAVAMLHSVGGTSFAALRANDPAAAALEIKNALMTTVDIVPTLDGQTVSGGRMNLRAAAEVIAAFDGNAINYCFPTTANSTGLEGLLSAEGSFDVADDMLTLHADQLPAGQATLFICSRNQGFIMNPNSSFGNLCLSGQIGRFNAQITFADGSGRASMMVPLTALPQGASTVAAMSGETWNFQAWHRDVFFGQSISNFTEGLSVTFN